MENLKCKTCGADLSISPDKNFATCKYCGGTYKLNEDLNVNIKLDDNVKDVIDNGMSIVGNTSKTMAKIMIVPFIIFIIFFVIIAFTIFKSINSSSTTEKDDFEIRSTTSELEMYSGTKDKIFVENALNAVIKNNKKNQDYLITVIYEDFNTTNTNDISEIKSSLENKKYEIILDYDGKYVNKLTIK